ncbi:MAG: hypothetical protein K5683_10815 [Prevotella sp.]|nr:hypothetical protein [Prevotella sp.]
MKKLLLTMTAIVMMATTAWAYDYAYLCLQKTDGSVAVVSTEGLTMSVTSSSSVTLTLNETDYEVSDLSYLWFTNTANGENVISVSSAGWATFCSSSALDYSSVNGLTAHTATFDTSQGIVTLYELSAAVPANTGVVLEGSEGTYLVPVASSASAPSNNDLLGTTSDLATTDSYYYYALGQNTDGTVGFKLVQSGVSIPANKAYYRYASNDPARSFLQMETGGEATAIDAIEVSDGDDALYDLQGRMVTNPDKGIYIRNGKKIIIK